MIDGADGDIKESEVELKDIKKISFDIIEESDEDDVG